MDRQILYPSEVLLDTDLLSMNKNPLVGLGYALQDILGAATCVAGFPCAQTTVASLAALVGPGRIYSLQVVDGTAYGSLPADTTDQLIKQGIQLGSVTLATPAPASAGQSINYLIEASYQDADTTPVVPPFYNAANPTVPFSGQNGNGAPLPTQRKGTVVVQAKAGAPAATGSQATPAPDAGFVGLYVVTVANGQATVTAANIAQAQNAPFIQSTLGNNTKTSNGGTSAAAGSVVEIWNVANGPANTKLWQWSANTVGAVGSLSLTAVPDTGIPGTSTAIAFARNGSAILDIVFGNTTDNPGFNFTGSGLLLFPNAVTTTAAPAAGGAGALPATPAGYFSLSIAGTVRRIPFYT